MITRVNNSNEIKLVKEITEWVIPANPADDDIGALFNQSKKLEWKQSTKIKVGDIVYIGSPIQEIKYKCNARKVDLSNINKEDNSQIKSETDDAPAYKIFIELELITK